jgi:hypothetical protein
MLSLGAFRKSPSGNMEEGRDVRGLLLGVEVPDSGGVAVISTAAAGFETFPPFFEETFLGVFFEAGWKYPRRAFILRSYEARTRI